MNISVYLKDGRVFSVEETAVLDDKEAGYFVLSCGKLIGGRRGRFNKPHYLYEDEGHIVYKKNYNVDHSEIYPDTEASDES